MNFFLHVFIVIKIDLEIFCFSFCIFIFRRIAYQEATQTFGVITSRIDFHDSYGLTPTRRSASTQAQNVTTR